MATNSRTRLILSTIDSDEAAKELAHQLLDDRLVACVNVHGPSSSIYRWEGELVEEEEWTVVAKSRREREDDVVNFIEEHHPYDCPEILVLEATKGSEAYEGWVQEQVR